MIFHASIPADDPQRVARVIAELWRGEFFPFVYPHSFIVLAGDDRGTEIEVLPRGLEHTRGQKEVWLEQNKSPSLHSEAHINMATSLTLPEIQIIARREGWTARVCDRITFNVIEFWLEDRFMLELMTPEELTRYQGFMTTANWRALMAKGPPPEVGDRWGGP